MSLPRRPHLASVALIVVVVFAVAGLAWGATHDGSAPHGYGSAATQAKARRALALSLKLPAGLANDATFTACGVPGDKCLTSTGDLIVAIQQLGVAFGSAGGSIKKACEQNPALSTPGNVQPFPLFTCGLQARLDGAWLGVTLGSGWLLPGKPQPRTAVLVSVETKAGDVFGIDVAATAASHAALPAAAPDVTALLPSGWTTTSTACTGAAACSAHTTTVAISVPGSTVTAAGEAFATFALSKGYRVDGGPCVNQPNYAGCQVATEKRVSGEPGALQHLLLATLVSDGAGNATGTVSVTDQS